MSRTRKRHKRWDDYEDEDFGKRSRIDRREEKRRKKEARLKNLRYDEQDNDYYNPE